MKKYLLSLVTSSGSVVRVYFNTFLEVLSYVKMFDNPRAFYIKYNSNPQKYEKSN